MITVAGPIRFGSVLSAGGVIKAELSNRLADCRFVELEDIHASFMVVAYCIRPLVTPVT